MNAISLRKNFVWTISGNIVYAATQWGMLIALANLGSPRLVGRYTLALTITAPIILFCGLQLRVVQATDASSRFEFRSFLLLRSITSAVQIALTVAIAIALRYTNETMAVIVAVGMIKVVEGISDICFGYLQKHEWMQRIAISQILRGVLSLMVLSLVLYCTGSLLLAVIGIGVIWLALLIFFDLRSVTLLRRTLSGDSGLYNRTHALASQNILALLEVALPLGFVSMLISSYWTLPRYLLEANHGEATLGYFAAMGYFIVAIMTVVEALGQSALPRLARNYRSDRTAFKRLLTQLLAVTVVIGLAGLAITKILGSFILRSFYGPRYSDYADIFPLLMSVGGIICVCSVLGVALNAAGLFKVQMWIFSAVLIVNTGVGLWLIPLHAIRGTVWTVLAGAICWVLFSGTAVAWACRREPSHLATSNNVGASPDA